MRESNVFSAASAIAIAVLSSNPAQAWITTGPRAHSCSSSRHNHLLSLSNFCNRGSASPLASPQTAAAGARAAAPGRTTARATSYRNRRRHVPTCRLERVPRNALRRIVPLRPTADKLVAQLGQTSTQRRRRLVDALVVAFVCYWGAFFASRTMLGSLAWRASYVALFIQIFVRPLVQSYSRASELWGPGGEEARSKTKGAVFTGRVKKTGFALSSEASDHQTHFQMLVEDEEGRELLFDVPQVPAYRSVRRGMRCEVVVLSRSAGFHELTGVTEAFLPELNLFVGRFPLVDKGAFLDLLQARRGRDKRELREADAARRKPPAQDGLSAERSGRGGGRGGLAAKKERSNESLRQDRSRGQRERVMAGKGSNKNGSAAKRTRRS